MARKKSIPSPFKKQNKEDEGMDDDDPPARTTRRWARIPEDPPPVSRSEAVTFQYSIVPEETPSSSEATVSSLLMPSRSSNLMDKFSELPEEAQSKLVLTRLVIDILGHPHDCPTLLALDYCYVKTLEDLVAISHEDLKYLKYIEVDPQTKVKKSAHLRRHEVSVLIMLQHFVHQAFDHYQRNHLVYQHLLTVTKEDYDDYRIYSFDIDEYKSQRASGSRAFVTRVEDVGCHHIDPPKTDQDQKKTFLPTGEEYRTEYQATVLEVCDYTAADEDISISEDAMESTYPMNSCDATREEAEYELPLTQPTSSENTYHSSVVQTAQTVLSHKDLTFSPQGIIEDVQQVIRNSGQWKGEQDLGELPPIICPPVKPPDPNKTTNTLRSQYQHDLTSRARELVDYVLHIEYNKWMYSGERIYQSVLPWFDVLFTLFCNEAKIPLPHSTMQGTTRYESDTFLQGYRQLVDELDSVNVDIEHGSTCSYSGLLPPAWYSTVPLVGKGEQSVGNPLPGTVADPLSARVGVRVSDSLEPSHLNKSFDTTQSHAILLVVGNNHLVSSEDKGKQSVWMESHPNTLCVVQATDLGETIVLAESVEGKGKQPPTTTFVLLPDTTTKPPPTLNVSLRPTDFERLNVSVSIYPDALGSPPTATSAVTTSVHHKYNVLEKPIRRDPLLQELLCTITNLAKNKLSDSTALVLQHPALSQLLCPAGSQLLSPAGIIFQPSTALCNVVCYGQDRDQETLPFCEGTSDKVRRDVFDLLSFEIVSVVFWIQDILMFLSYTSIAQGLLSSRRQMSKQRGVIQVRRYFLCLRQSVTQGGGG